MSGTIDPLANLYNAVSGQMAQQQMPQNAPNLLGGQQPQQPWTNAQWAANPAGPTALANRLAGSQQAPVSGPPSSPGVEYGRAGADVLAHLAGLPTEAQGQQQVQQAQQGSAGWWPWPAGLLGSAAARGDGGPGADQGASGMAGY
jgi:hypothetical protein